MNMVMESYKIVKMWEYLNKNSKIKYLKIRKILYY